MIVQSDNFFIKQNWTGKYLVKYKNKELSVYCPILAWQMLLRMIDQAKEQA